MPGTAHSFQTETGGMRFFFGGCVAEMREIGSRCGFVSNFDLSFFDKTLAESWTHR
jgi:hypothetical protein